jgi:hypothetical protein
MVYEQAGVLTIGLDRRPDKEGRVFGVRQPEVERVVCTHCAEGLFEYSTENGWSPDRSKVIPGQFVERITAYTVVAMFVSFPIGAFTVLLALSGVAVSTAATYGALALIATVAVTKLL